MAGARQVVPGLNHNVRHRGKAYHVQTEDLGLGNPRVVTHLFQGGSVLAARRTSYAELIGAPEPARAVRRLMEQQHKAKLRDLINGAYDGSAEGPAACAGACVAEPAPGPALPVPRPPPIAPGERLSPGVGVPEGDDPDDSIDRAILAYLAGDRDEELR